MISSKVKKIVFWLIIVVGYTAICSFLLWKNSPVLFSWPDEMANYNFAQQFAQSGNLIIAEPLNSQYGDIVFPRSTGVANHSLAPTGFPILPAILGIFKYIFKTDVAMILLTPFMA